MRARRASVLADGEFPCNLSDGSSVEDLEVVIGRCLAANCDAYLVPRSALLPCVLSLARFVAWRRFGLRVGVLRGPPENVRTRGRGGRRLHADRYAAFIAAEHAAGRWPVAPALVVLTDVTPAERAMVVNDLHAHHPAVPTANLRSCENSLSRWAGWPQGSTIEAWDWRGFCTDPLHLPLTGPAGTNCMLVDRVRDALTGPHPAAGLPDRGPQTWADTGPVFDLLHVFV